MMIGLTTSTSCFLSSVWILSRMDESEDELDFDQLLAADDVDAVAAEAAARSRPPSAA